MSEDVFIRAQKGEPGAFELLLLNYEKLLFCIAYRYMGNADDAKDITQDAVLKIYSYLPACKNWSGFKSWAARIVVNTALDELRRRKSKPVVSLDDRLDDFSTLSDETSSPETIAVSRETIASIMCAIHQLPADAQSLIILRDLQGFSYNELSQTLKLPIGTVKSKLSRARVALKKLLSNA